MSVRIHAAIAIDHEYLDRKSKNDLLSHTFWTSLHLDQLIRHKYDTIREYGVLLREIRQTEKGTESHFIKRYCE